jgi:hypothetical protein
MTRADRDVLHPASSRVREGCSFSESPRAPPPVMPKVFHAGTTSFPHRDGALAAGGGWEAGLRDRLPGMTSAVRRRGSSSTNIGVAWRYCLQSKSLELFDECRALDVQEFGSAIPVSSGSIQRSLNQVTLNSGKIGRHVETIVGKLHEGCLSG